MGGDVVIVAGDPALQNDLASRYGVNVQKVDGQFHFQVDRGAEFVPRVVMDFKDRVQSIQIKHPSLDDVFLQLTGRAIREEEGSQLDQMRLGAKMWMRRR